MTKIDVEDFAQWLEEETIFTLDTYDELSPSKQFELTAMYCKASKDSIKE